MDRFMESPWFMKIVALVLALLLFSSVPKNEPSKGRDVNVPSDQTVETIAEVPVKAYYDTQNLVVSGIPDTVSVTLQGPKNIIQPAKTLKNFEVYVDLTNAELGNQRLPIRIKDVSDRLKVTIEPAYVNVSVQEKVTKEFRVEAEFDRGLIEEGYLAADPIVDPGTVKITGAKDMIEKISYVKATLNIKGPIHDSITREARIRVLDKELNKLDVLVEPETVDVTIPIKASSKTVPINIVEKGTLPAGISIQSMTLDTKEATVLGSPKTLDATDSVRVEVDLSKISNTTELTLPVIIKDGIVKVTPELVKVKVQVNTQEEKTISNVPIKIEGLSEQYDVTFLNPADGSANLLVSGTRDKVNPLSASDFDVTIDVSNLKEGQHNLNVQVDGPNNVNWKLGKESASVSIKQKGA